MKRVFFKELEAFQFHSMQKFSDQVGHAVFSRKGGVSKKPYDSLNVRFGIGDDYESVKKNRRIICNSLDIDSKKLISANQIHSKNVKIIDRDFADNHEPDMETDNVDGLITNEKDVALMVQVADCQAILMFDPIKRVVAAVHVGWKGLKQDISGMTINVMKNKFGVDPMNLMVGIAPSLGPCCAFFSEPEKELPDSFQKLVDKEKRVDLWSYSMEQLQKHGVPKNNIELARVCTQCGNGPSIEGPHGFFSFRGDKGITGRFGVLIALK